MKKEKKELSESQEKAKQSFTRFEKRMHEQRIAKSAIVQSKKVIKRETQKTVGGVILAVAGIFIVWYLLRSRLGNFRNAGSGIQEYFSSALKSPIVSIPNIPEEYQRRPPGFQMMR